MELGIGMFGDLSFDKATQSYQSPSEKLQEIISQVKLADELGIHHFALGEHHRADYAVAAPEIVLAALATVTKQIKLSSGVSVLSSTDPVKLYQDFATLDLLSHQRSEIMAGRGSFIESFPLFGYDLKDYNELFEEKLDLLLQLNREKTIQWQGKYRAPIHQQVIYPRPERALPVWIAVGGTPQSVLRAARLGLPIIFAIIGGQPLQFKPLIDYYKSKYIESGHDPKQMQIGVHAHTFIASSKEEVVGLYFESYAKQMNRIGKDRGWSGSYTKDQFLAGMSASGALVMGSPDEVAEKITHLCQAFGLTRFVAHLDVGAPAHENMMQMINYYGKEVMPKVQDSLKA